MAILSTVKKVIPYIKEAAGYVLCHISSQAVEMDDGTLLQDKIESMDAEIDGKAPASHTHDNSDIIGLTPDKAVISSGSGELTTFNNVTSTEVGYLEGVTSNIQDQIDTLNSNLGDLSWLSTSEKKDMVAAVNEVYWDNYNRRMKFGAWTGTNIDPLKWTNIMNFQLDAGSYLIMWKCKVGAVQSSGAIWGTRIRWDNNQQQELQNHISNQENSMSCFTWVKLSSKTTIYIDFYHNIQNQYPFISLKQSFVFPIIVDGTLDNQ